MNKLFDGLLQYEMLLSILGMVLFLVLLFLLVYMIVTGKKVGSILGFFMIPIIMIGFPGIKKIQFKDIILELEESLAQSSNNDPTPEQQTQVEEIISKIHPDRISSFDNTITVSKAYAYIGDTLNAYRSAEEALKVEPSSQLAINLRDNFSENSMVKIDQKIEDIKQNPSNQSLKQELNQELQKVQSESLEAPVDYLIMARANEAIGKKEEASKYTDSALLRIQNIKKPANSIGD